MVVLVAANGAPIIARRALGERLDLPLDLGIRIGRDAPLLGRSKTWRGVAAGVLAGMLAAVLVGWSPELGAMLGAAAMVGDALTSFIKRRLGLEPGQAVALLDQTLEAATPLLLVREPLELGAWDVVLLVVAFAIVDLAISPVLHRLGIRRRAL